MTDISVAAVDLGATSGRVVLGRIDHGHLTTEIVHRFPNRPVRLPDGLHWDVTGLFTEVIDGLTHLLRAEPDVASVGIDSWAIDYGLLRDGRLLGLPHHYRDDRTASVIDRVHHEVPAEELYRRNGLQFLPFTTVYQMVADADLLALADTALLIPDLLTYWLTGERIAEVTNASTTGLLDVHTRSWDIELCDRLHLPSAVLPDTVEPGHRVGPILPELQIGPAGAQGLEVVTVGSHDTASAVVAVPMDPTSAAYISCGTWGIVGVEIDRPIVGPEARAANFTNEGGVDGRVRFLHNVVGLWLLSETIRTWETTGERIGLDALLAEAAAVTAPVGVFDPNDDRLLAPGDMPSRIEALCREHGHPVPRDRAEMVRAILSSLASAFARAVHTAATLSGVDVRTIHMVGGGALNSLLCQLTADASGLEVRAGPVEATAIGNVLVQARAASALTGDTGAMRAAVARSTTITTYMPRPTGSQR